MTVDSYLLQAYQVLPHCSSYPFRPIRFAQRMEKSRTRTTSLSTSNSWPAELSNGNTISGITYVDLSFYTRELALPVLCLAILSPMGFSLISSAWSIGLLASLVLFPHLARRISPHLMLTSMLDALDIRAGATLSLCAGITALLLQTYNPQIAYAVHRHSDLHSRPLTRLLRTFIFVELALNGTAQEKEQISSWLRWIHRGVYGSLPPALQQTRGTDGADADYGYTDELKAYVLQTLTWSTIEFCNRFGRRLDKRGRDHIVLQFTCIGYQLGVPHPLLAKDFSTFSNQFNSRLQRISQPRNDTANGDLCQESFATLEHTTLTAGNSWATRLLLRCAFLVGHELLPPEVKRSYRPQMLESWISRATQYLLLFILWLVYPCFVWLPLRGVIALFCILEPAVRRTVESTLRTIHCMDPTVDKPTLRPGRIGLTDTAFPDFVHWLSSGNKVTISRPPLFQVFLCRILTFQISSKHQLRDWTFLLARTFVDFWRMFLSGVTLWISKRRAEIVVGRIAAFQRRHDSSHPNLPYHVGCIMDGNRRYARSRHAAISVGHAQGAIVAVRLLGWWIDSVACLPSGPRVLTLWAFSSDNFKRSPDEVQTLFDLMTAEFRALAFSSIVHLTRMRVRVIGSRAQFPVELLLAIDLLEQATAMYDELHLLLAVGYGGRQEVVDSVGRVLSKGETVTESAITRETYCAQSGLPPVDLLLRTSERRTSGFMLWDTQAAELHFIDKLWPELNQLDWLSALESYANRDQRYGA